MPGVFIRIFILVFLYGGFSPGHCTLKQKEKGRQDNSHHIRWHSTINNDNTAGSTGFWNRIIDKIAGKEQISISRPVAYIKPGANSAYILCQESGKVLTGKRGKFVNYENRKDEWKTFPSLVDACAIPGNDILFTDSYLNSIFQASENGILTKFNTSVQLERPTGIDYSPVTSTIWVSESAEHRLSEFSLDGKLIKRVGIRGTGPLEFNYPTHLCIDGKGFIYVIDAMNFRVQILDRDGNFIGSFGEHGDATGKFARPKGIAVDSRGNIFIVDALFNSVQVFTREGELLYYFGSHGSENGEFILPAGISIDDNDYIYISDTYNNRIQVFEPGSTRE
ncbi:MAG: 6-bladed beta-propeller [Marinilabiliaceae bacterium]|jgi:DNA-binding beta-propeller fold protein YncE|nr:6-bladed beta-propeller [Marinilabiliaceae bacterium]